MDKIKDLLKQLKASDELSNQFVSALTEWKGAIEKATQEEFNKRLDSAKQVCLEEVEKEKSDLRRKVEVFLEARINTINREAQKQAAIGESDASKTLRDLKGLLEGVRTDSGTEEAQAAIAEAKKLRVAFKQLQEEKAQLEEKAKRANIIAMRAINRVKVLESKGAEDKPLIDESTQKPEGGVKRLEDLRTKSEDPKTTRQTLVESQVKAGAKTPAEQGHPGVMAIASELDGSPAFI